MRTIIEPLFIIFLLLIPLLKIQAQGTGNTVVKGSVLNEMQAPVPYATILLKRAADSSLYKGELTTENGLFVFDPVSDGSYLLEISLVGYEKIIKPVNINAAAHEINLGNIRLTVSSKTLKTVTVEAQKPFIERLPDRMIVNIENSSIHTGSSVIEVMEKLPGVKVNQDGTVSLKGKAGLIVSMDGKPTVLSGQDLANMLRGMTSENIQKIEIISNPSAKFDAAGNAGIINIITKRNKKEGINGNVTAGYGQGRYEKYNAGFNLSLKQDWYNISLGYSFSHRKSFSNLTLTRNFFKNEVIDTSFKTDNYTVSGFNTHNPRLGGDFYLSPNTTLSVSGSALINEIDANTKSRTDIYDGKAHKVSAYDFTNNTQVNWSNYNANMQLHHTFDTSGKDLSAELYFIEFTNNSDQQLLNILKDLQENPIDRSLLIGDQGGDLKIYVAKADYIHPLRHNMKLEIGWKSSYVSSNSDNKFFQQLPDSLAFDSSLSNHFIYKENINAAYLNFHKDFTQLSVQLGLRLEQTHADGEQRLSGVSFTRNYVQLFPSAFFDYKFNEMHDLNLSVGRRIDRPAYPQLNPYRSVIDATTYAEGNPELRPQYTYNTELTYGWDNSLFVTLGFSTTSDNITNVLTQDATTKKTLLTFANLARFNYYNINIVYSKKLFKWWTTNTSLLGYYGKYSGTTIGYAINDGIPSFQFNTSNSFAIKKGLSVECSFLYAHRSLDAFNIMKPTENFSIGMQKSILSNRGAITLNVRDIFWGSYPRGTTVFKNVEEQWISKRDSRVLNLTFSYRFGKGELRRAKPSTGADDEKNRAN
jgi:iron complex outermembrane receptor protein